MGRAVFMSVSFVMTISLANLVAHVREERPHQPPRLLRLLRVRQPCSRRESASRGAKATLSRGRKSVSGMDARGVQIATCGGFGGTPFNEGIHIHVQVG